MTKVIKLVELFSPIGSVLIFYWILAELPVVARGVFNNLDLKVFRSIIFMNIEVPDMAGRPLRGRPGICVCSDVGLYPMTGRG